VDREIAVAEARLADLLFILWTCERKVHFLAVLKDCAMHSITTRANEDGEAVKDRLHSLRQWFRTPRGEGVAHKQYDSLLQGRAFQTIVTDFPFPSSQRPEHLRSQQLLIGDGNVLSTRQKLRCVFSDSLD
jgi:hypothetical protein